MITVYSANTNVIRVIVKGAELKEFTDGEKVYLDFDKIMVFDRD